MPIKTYQDEQPSINLTPMIDIVFLLIIFFMVGTEFVEMERELIVDVPRVSDGAALTAAPEKRIIKVYRDGRVALDDQPLTIGELQSRLAAARMQYAGLGVIVRGDAEGAFQNVASVLDACRQAGISEMGISVKLARKGE
jgi:biopolymer transport protein ExbD